tara:strand:+ start:835 stop:1791 length:957 start_codon:yes stop_codon:yes gene_type:complete
MDLFRSVTLDYLLSGAILLASALPSIADPVIIAAKGKEKPYKRVEKFEPPVHKPDFLIPTNIPKPDRRVPAVPKEPEPLDPFAISDFWNFSPEPDFEPLGFSKLFPETGEFLTLSQKQKFYHDLRGFDDGTGTLKPGGEAIVGAYMLTIDWIYTTNNPLMKFGPTKWLIGKGVNFGEAGLELMPYLAEGVEAVTTYNLLAGTQNIKYHERIQDRLDGRNDLGIKHLHPIIYKAPFLGYLLKNPPTGFGGVHLNANSDLDKLKVRDLELTVFKYDGNGKYFKGWTARFGLLKVFNESDRFSREDQHYVFTQQSSIFGGG